MRRAIALLGLPLLVLAGCAAPGSDPAEPPAGSPDHRWEAFHQRAAEVADAWQPGTAWRSGYVPLERPTVLTGDPGFTGDTKLAFGYGWFRDQIDLPTATPPEGTIRFPDGTLRVPLVSAAEAYDQLDQGDPPSCDGRPKTRPKPDPKDGPTIEPGPDGQLPTRPRPDSPVTTHVDTPCVPLTVTGVRLGTAPLRTSRGTAEVPAWIFTVEGLRVPVAQVAVAPSAVGARPEGVAPARPVPDGVVTAQSLDAVNGSRLDYKVGTGACDTGVTPLVLERDDVVVVGAGVTRSTGVCTAQLVLKPVSVTLKAPLGDRAVLDVGSGTPLTVVRR